MVEEDDRKNVEDLCPTSMSKQWSMVDSIFPPSNHENLIPDSDYPPQSPTSPFSFSPSDSDVPQSPVAVFPAWWSFAIRILRAKIGNFEKRRPFWSFRNVAVAAVVLMWWVGMRMRRRWRRRERVRHLLEVIKHKDEEIIRLLNKIVHMNELLRARNVQPAKLAG